MANSLVIAAFVTIGVILLGTLLTIVAVVTPNWAVVEHKGHDIVQDSLIACRGTNISAIVVAGLACFTSVLWLLRAKASSKKRSVLPTFALEACILAAILVVVTLVVYIIQLYQPAEDLATLGYSIYLNAVGAFLLLTGGIIFRVVAEVRMTSFSDSPSGQMPSMPHRHDPLFFHNLQRLDDDSCQGLAFQQPQSTVLKPPTPYTQYPEEQQEYMAHLKRDLDEGQYTPGETRKSAPGSSAI